MKDTLRRQFFFSNVVEALFSSLVYLWCSKYAGDDFLSHNHAASSQNVLLKIMKRSSRKENSKYMSACCNHENCGVSVFHKSESQVHESHGHKTATSSEHGEDDESEHKSISLTSDRDLYLVYLLLKSGKDYNGDRI